MYVRSLKTGAKWLKKIGLYKPVQYLVSWWDEKDRLFDTDWVARRRRLSDVFKYSTGKFLIKHFYGYMGHDANPNTGDLGLAYLHYAFVRAIRPERILCIGSKEGFIPAVLALACKDNGRGHVDFVDAGRDIGEKNNWGGTGFWKKIKPTEHFAPFEIHKYLTLHVMTSKVFARKYPHRKFEYIYIDGDHSYEGVNFDFQTFWPRLAALGMMSFHDVTMKGLDGGVEYGMWKLWRELNRKLKHTVMFTRGENNNAVGFIQKLE